MNNRGNMSNKDFNLLITDGDRQLLLNGSTDFSILKEEEPETAHIVDVLSVVVLDKLLKETGAVLGPGDYRIALTVAVSSIAESATPPPLPDVTQLAIEDLEEVDESDEG